MTGGLGDDVLNGEAGFDAYDNNTGDGIDQIEDRALELVLT